MIRTIFVFSVLLLFSCSKKSEIKNVDGKSFLVFESSGITSIEEVDWRVGPLGRDSLSKGVKFKVVFPQFEEKKFESLAKENEIDSWVIQVRHVTFEKIKVIGQGIIPLYVTSGVAGFGNPERTFRQISQVSVNAFYESAAFSPRFARMNCPADNHRLKVKDFKLIEGEERNFTEIKEQGQIYVKIPDNILVSALVANGGKKLVGQYIIEIALFSSVKKKRMTDFVVLNKRANINQEEIKTISSCD